MYSTLQMLKKSRPELELLGTKSKKYKTTNIINHPDTGVIHHINVLSSKVTVIVTGWCWSALQSDLHTVSVPEFLNHLLILYFLLKLGLWILHSSVCQSPFFHWSPRPYSKQSCRDTKIKQVSKEQQGDKGSIPIQPVPLPLSPTPPFCTIMPRGRVLQLLFGQRLRVISTLSMLYDDILVDNFLASQCNLVIADLFITVLHFDIFPSTEDI